MYQTSVSYFDFELKKPVPNEKVFSFEQDIRDYISVSPQAVLLLYKQEHLQPI